MNLIILKEEPPVGPDHHRTVEGFRLVSLGEIYDSKDQKSASASGRIFGEIPEGGIPIEIKRS